MKTSDFRKAAVCTGELDYWVLTRTIKTDLGEFEVILETLDDGDHEPPDESMVERAKHLSEFCIRHQDMVTRIAFGAYLHLLRTNPQELIGSRVPLGLGLTSIKDFLQDRKMVVSRSIHDPLKRYLTKIVIIPDWDCEHALNLSVSDGQIAEVNEHSFTLEAGELRLD